VAYYNPAAIAFQTIPTATLAYSVLSLDRKLNFLSFTKSLKPNAGISLSIINAGVGNIDGRDRDGIHTDTYSTSENAFMLSFCLRPAPSFSLGITTKILYHVLFEEMNSTSVAIDVGALYILSPEFTLAAVIQDINAKYNWNSTKLYGILGNDFSDRFPLRRHLGISWTPLWYPCIFSCEYESVGTESFVRFGAEVKVIEGLQIRGGIDQIALTDEMAAKPALGMAFQTNATHWSPSFQYTYIFEPYSPSGVHIVSLSLRFQ